MSIESFALVSLVSLGLGFLVSDWTITNCSHCGSALIRRFYGISPFLRISPAFTIGLFGWICYSVLTDEESSYFKTIVLIVLSVGASVFVIMVRRAYIPKNFRTCTYCGRKPDLGFRQLFWKSYFWRNNADTHLLKWVIDYGLSENAYKIHYQIKKCNAIVSINQKKWVADSKLRCTY